MNTAPTIIPPDDLSGFAATAIKEHKATVLGLSYALEHAMAAGAALTEVKNRLERGQWLPWLERLEQQDGPSVRMAQNYMRLAEARTTLAANTQRVSYLSVRGALSLLKTSKANRQRVAVLRNAPREKAQKLTRYDAIGWWSLASVVERQQFIDCIGSHALAAAIPAHWNMTLVATEADLGDIDKAKMVQTEARLAPDIDDLDIPPYLRRAPAEIPFAANGMPPAAATRSPDGGNVALSE